VAWVKRGEGMAQVTWKENVGKPRTFQQKLFSLPYNLRNAWVSSLLWSKLLQKSSTKNIKSITRGFRPVTYNLEVEGTHCLMANGVIAHNSMDAFMYGLQSLVPMIQRRDMLAMMPKFPPKPKVHPGR